MAYGVTDFEGVVVGAMDARRQQVYNALFRQKTAALRDYARTRAVAMELVAEELAAMPEPKLIVGDGAVLLYDFFAESGDRVPAGLALHWQQSAAGVALVAEHLAAQGLTCSAGIAAGVSAAQPGRAGAAGQGLPLTAD